VKNAVVWFEKAADQGMAPAQYALGQMYLNGEGVEQSVNKAVELYTHAANQGLLEAQADLGFLYATREDKVPQDFLFAYKWLSLAAQKGDKIAKTDLVKLVATMTNDQIAEAKELVRKESS
jgi:TPR repeat protein